MAEKYDLAAVDYVAGMKYKDIAEKYEVSIDTVKSWKKRHWKDIKKGAPKTQKSVHTKNTSAQNKQSAAEQSKFNDENLINITFDEPGAIEEEPQNEGEFTHKQRLFISYYVRYWNATKAYKKAYGCDYNTARNNGSRLLANACIREEIIKARDALTEDAMLNKRTLLQKWIDIAFADITDFVEFGSEQEVVRNWETGEVELDANGNPKMRTFSYVHLKDDAEVDGTILTSVTLGKDGVGVKLADKMKALEYLSKHIYLLSDTEKTKFENEQRKAKALAEKAEIEVKTLRKNDGNQVTKVVFVDDIGGDEDGDN